MQRCALLIDVQAKISFACKPTYLLLAMNSLFGGINNIISLAITPAFLLLGVMMQMRVLTNRLARIIDRCRVLEHKRSAGQGLSAALKHELVVLYRRMDAIHRASGLSAACMILICIAVVALFGDDAFNLRLDSLIALLFVFAMLLLIASFSLFLHEIFIASHSLPGTALHRARRVSHPHNGGNHR